MLNSGARAAGGRGIITTWGQAVGKKQANRMPLGGSAGEPPAQRGWVSTCSVAETGGAGNGNPGLKDGQTVPESGRRLAALRRIVPVLHGRFPHRQRPAAGGQQAG